MVMYGFKYKSCYFKTNLHSNLDGVPHKHAENIGIDTGFDRIVLVVTDISLINVVVDRLPF